MVEEDVLVFALAEIERKVNEIMGEFSPVFICFCLTGFLCRKTDNEADVKKITEKMWEIKKILENEG